MQLSENFPCMWYSFSKIRCLVPHHFRFKIVKAIKTFPLQPKHMPWHTMQTMAFGTSGRVQAKRILLYYIVISKVKGVFNTRYLGAISVSQAVLHIIEGRMNSTVRSQQLMGIATQWEAFPACLRRRFLRTLLT